MNFLSKQTPGEDWSPIIQFDEHIFQMGREKPANSSLSLQQNIHKTGEEQVSTKARSLPLKLSPEKKSHP